MATFMSQSRMTPLSCVSSMILFLTITLSSIAIASSEQPSLRQQQQDIYGTQCSFAFTGPNLDGCPELELKHRQKFYDDYMRGCYRYYSFEDCHEEELDRFKMNMEQPRSMVNMTSTGYMKIQAPPKLKKLLFDFWESNSPDKKLEYWGAGNVYTNHWDSPTYMVSVEDDHLEGAGEELKKAVWDAAIDGISEWTGGVAKIRPVSLYGIRMYTEGSVLSPHVDRVPLVSSGIVNVAQDVDEPWPLEVYDRNGHAVNITMEPGEMILYESHSLIHGRPFPLKGRYYANIFIHFEPYDGWDSARDRTKLGDNTGKLPPYILPGSPEEKRYLEDNPNGWFLAFAEGEEPPVGEYAAEGNLEALMEAAKTDERLLWFQDSNGWQPLHEAIRGGHLNVVKYLIENGANKNVRTHEDASPLRIAINMIGEHHKVTRYLKKIGAEDHGDVVDEYVKNDDNDDAPPLDDDWMDGKTGAYDAESYPTETEHEEQQQEPSIERIEHEVLELEQEALKIEKRILAEVPTIVADDDEDL